ncbi:hypothetical protein ACFWCF_13765 [Rhodococcus sp. NPDC060090]
MNDPEVTSTSIEDEGHQPVGGNMILGSLGATLFTLLAGLGILL